MNKCAKIGLALLGMFLVALTICVALIGFAGPYINPQ